MSNTKELEETACCNVIVWDFFITAITAGFIFVKLVHIHWGLSIVLGIIAGLIISLLMMIKYLGAIIQFGFSIIWCIGLEKVIDEIFGIYKYVQKNSIQMWVIRVVAVLIIFVIHLLWNALMFDHYFGIAGEDFFKRIFNKKRNAYYDNLEMEFYRISIYRNKMSDIQDRLCKLVENRAVSLEEWSGTHDILKETADNYNDIASKKAQYSARPRMRCKQIALIISDIQSKILLIDKNIKHMEQSLNSFEKRMEEEEREHRQKKENYNYQGDNAYNDSHQSKYRESQNSNSQNQQNTEDTALIALFAGCNDKESLRKRYRELMKIYHPDNFNGDNEMCQKIQSIYEKLCNEHKDNS